MTFKIRLISACRRTELKVGKFHFSDAFSPEEADALLCEWAPHEELLTFPKPKAWYCCEATHRELFTSPAWSPYVKALKPSEFLYHAHPDPHYRVPHITIEDDIPINHQWPRTNKAVAIVSNVGGPPWRRGKDMALRARFITHPLVDLYGQQEAWSKFQATPLAKPGPPANYKGELPGYWTDNARFECMAQYHAAVCFENTSEPYYFTEKLVGAVQTGCIPVYHAHETVRATFLQGAAWVDPADFKHNVKATLQFALNADIQEYWKINNKWLQSSAIINTHASAVFERIGTILCR